MISTIAIPQPETVDSAFGKLAGRRRRLLEKQADLIVRGAKAQNDGRSEEYSALGRELVTAERELGSVQVDFHITELDAREVARRRLSEQPEYRSLVARCAADLGERLGPWLELKQVVTEAGEHGIRMPPVPGTIAAEITLARQWLRSQVVTGALSLGDVPLELRALCGGVDGGEK